MSTKFYLSKHSIKFLAIMLISILSLCGCHTSRPIGEILGTPKKSDYFLGYNIWTDGKHKLSSINYLIRPIIPFGTKVKVMDITNKSITFKILSEDTFLNGQEYTIIYYKKYGLKNIDYFIKNLITTKNRSELTKGLPKSHIPYLLSGDLKKGMTKREVILLYGPPSPHRTSIQSTTWTYWMRRFPFSLTAQIHFEQDKVVSASNKLLGSYKE